MKNQIKKYRLLANMTQTELAAAVGCESQSTIAMWELGERKPPSDKLLQIAKVLNCTVDELLADADPDPSEETA